METNGDREIIMIGDDIAVLDRLIKRGHRGGGR
jgi:hypothetical protein